MLDPMTDATKKRVGAAAGATGSRARIGCGSGIAWGATGTPGRVPLRPDEFPSGEMQQPATPG